MRNFFGIFLFCIWAIFARYHYVCKIKNHCNAEPENTTLSLLYEEKVLLENYEHFHFDINSIKPNLSENNHAFLDRVAKWLADHPEQNLNITGVYTADEAGGRGIYENLGLARAAVVRDLIVRRDIDEERITLDFKPGITLEEPLWFAIYDEEKASGTGKLQYSFYDMTYSDANFEYNSAKFEPGDEFKRYADSLGIYLGKFSDKTLQIIGHTDSIGGDVYNDGLGLQRAIAAKAYFENMGLKNKIVTETRGRKEPISKNNDKESRKKNRRVNFVID